MILSTHYHVRRFIRVNDVQILKTSPHSAHLRKDSHLITEKKKQIFYRKPPQNLTNLQFSCKMLSNTSIKAVFHQTFIRQCGSRTRNVWEPINLDISSQGFFQNFPPNIIQEYGVFFSIVVLVTDEGILHDFQEFIKCLIRDFIRAFLRNIYRKNTWRNSWTNTLRIS